MNESVETLPAFDPLWNFGDPAGTEAAFRALLPAAERVGGDYRLELLTQIARTQGLQRQFDAAHATLDQAEALLPPGPSRPRLRLLLERGRALNSSGKPDLARPLFVEAWELGCALPDDGLAVDAAHMIAIVEKDDEALAWNMKAIAYAEASADPAARKWLASLYNNTGWTWHGKGDANQALALFEKALTLREQQGVDSNIRVAKWCIARALKTLGRLDEALAMQQALAATGEADGYVDEELGELWLAKGEAGLARPFFQKAHAALSADAWLAEKEPERIARLGELGR